MDSNDNAANKKQYSDVNNNALRKAKNDKSANPKTHILYAGIDIDELKHAQTNDYELPIDDMVEEPGQLTHDSLKKFLDLSS